MGASIVIVGGGKMGEAIMGGWIASQTVPAADISSSDIAVIEPGGDRRAYLEETYGVTCYAEADALGAAVEPAVVVLAVKPQVMSEVLAQLRSAGIFGDPAAPASDRPLVVSIAAGLPTRALQTDLPEGIALVRVMPNLPLMVGAGASGVCAGSAADDDQVRYVCDLFGCLGRAVVVSEDEMDAVCALSGSGPAYVAALIEAMRDAAASQGLPIELAETLALQTVLGTAQMIDRTDFDARTLREAVSSPGGTTLAALDAMATAGFAESIAAGVDAAVIRSKELAQCI